MISLFVFALLAIGSHAITNDKVVRQYDMKGNIMFASYNITFSEEAGASLPESYLFPLEFDKSHLSTISFYILGAPTCATLDEAASMYTVSIPENARKEASLTLIVKAVFFDIARPYPATLRQLEQQSVRLEGNIRLKSPYASKVDELYVPVHTTSYQQASNEMTFRLDLETFYCTAKNIEPNTNSTFYIHYSSPTPFLDLPLNEREVILSHVAPSRVQEHVSVLNSGAKLVGELNGYVTLSTRNERANIINEINFQVPLAATDFSYRDEIGNISTSELHNSPQATLLTVQPRFGLFGGWKTKFYFEYYIPFKALISSFPTRSFPAPFFFFSDDASEQSSRTLSTPRAYAVALPLAPSAQHAACEEAVLRIALPEGAQDVAVAAEIDGVTKDDCEPITKSVMDYLGRRTLILRRKNMINSPAFSNVYVTYNLPTLYRIHKPLILLAIAVCFVCSILLIVRLVRWYRAGPLSQPLVASGKKNN